MTLILLDKHRVYTDSRHFVGREPHDSLTKVRPLSTPVRVLWKPDPDLPTDEDRNPERFVDVIHGWTITGDNTVGMAFVDTLQKAYMSKLEMATEAVADDITGESEPQIGDVPAPSVKLHVLYRMIEHAGHFRLFNYLNHFTLILLGEKASYAIGPDDLGSKEPTARLQVITRDNPSAMGSGAESAMRDHFLFNDPLHAVYAAMLDNRDTVGGMIDVWDLPTEEHPRLRRAGVCNARSGKELVELLRRPVDPEQPLEMDFIAMNHHNALVDAAALIGETIGMKKAEEIFTKETAAIEEAADALPVLEPVVVPSRKKKKATKTASRRATKK